MTIISVCVWGGGGGVAAHYVLRCQSVRLSVCLSLCRSVAREHVCVINSSHSFPATSLNLCKDIIRFADFSGVCFFSYSFSENRL